MRLWSRLSLQTRLVATVALLLLLALLASGVAAGSLLRNYLEGRVDQELVSTLERLQGPVGDRRGPGPAPLLPSRYAVALLGADGEVLRSTDGDGDNDETPDLSAEDADLRSGVPFTRGSDDHEWRMAVAPVAGGRYIAVATSLEDVEATTQRLSRVVLLVGLAVLAFGVAVGLALVRASLKPLRRIEASAGAIAEGDLSHRVPEDAAPGTEVGSLSRSLNVMLGQIEEAFAVKDASEQRMRRFVADASHELRTPLTSIRGFAELYRQGAAHEPEETARLMQRIEEESVRMSALVEDLLMLARLDQQRPLRQEPVDLGVIANDVVHDIRATAPDHTVTLDLGGWPNADSVIEQRSAASARRDHPPAAVEVLGDEARLRQVLINLVANAVRHTPAGTSVTVRVRRLPDAGVVEVIDDGPGIPTEAQPRLFEGFSRADSSRARGSGGGSGLGLTIVDALVRAHGGEIDLESTPGHGATFRVFLPLA